MTRSVRYAFLLAALVVAFAVPPGASATSTLDCQTAIDDLRDATAASTFLGKQAAKEEAGLLRTLDGASETLSAGKLADTIKKLTDFQSHAVTLGQDGKLDPVDAARLEQLADAAIACVAAIGT